MHVVIKLKLKTTSYDEQIIDRRFHALSHIHNVLVKHARKLLIQLEHDKEYQDLKAKYIKLLKKKKFSKTDKQRKTELSKQLNNIIAGYHLSEYDFQSYIKLCAKQYRKLLSSMQVQKEATRVWKGVKEILYGDGKKLHFKKFINFHTIGGKNNTNGIKFDKETNSIDWLGLMISCHIKNDSYIKESLQFDISYCELERQMFSNGWHYYVVVVLKGNAPTKNRQVGTGVMGIDPGVSSLAGVSDIKLFLEELAPKSIEYNKKIQKLLRQMDTSRRAMNPDKYNKNGTINKSNYEPWVFSNTYKKKRCQLKTIYRKKSAYVKQCHEILCNQLLTAANYFKVEKMPYKSLQKKSKKTERQSKAVIIKQKDGTKKQVCKYKKKKRFGKSLNNRSPALLLTILKRKCNARQCIYEEIDAKEIKASQYNHVTNTYEKIPLSQRNKIIGEEFVQRDLYSAFLLKNVKSNHINQDMCSQEFKAFVYLQNELIEKMKQNKKSMKQCFGF